MAEIIRHSLPFAVYSTEADGHEVLVFEYDTADPFVITLVIDDDHTWSFDRQLLEQGMERPAGVGDVRVWPFGAHTAIVLDSPNGRALMLFDSIQLARFVSQVTKCVPRPRADVDAFIDQIREWS